MSLIRSRLARRTNGGRRWIALAAAGLLLGWTGLAADDTVANRPPEVITRVRDFWAIAGDARKQVRPVRLEFTVCYYDPAWNLLWAEGDDGISFVLCPKKPLPIAAGQRIAVEGLMSPAGGLSLENARIKVVAENVPLRPGSWDYHG